VSKRDRDRAFDDIATEFVKNPWIALNSESVVVDRLRTAWPAKAYCQSNGYLIAALEEFSRSDGPVLAYGANLFTVVLGMVGHITGREIWCLSSDTDGRQRVARALQAQGVSTVNFLQAPTSGPIPIQPDKPPFDALPRDFSFVVSETEIANAQQIIEGILSHRLSDPKDRVAILVPDEIAATDDIVSYWPTPTAAKIHVERSGDGFTVLEAGRLTLDESDTAGAIKAAVTVAIPVFNDGNRIGKSIDSVLSQSFSNFRLLVSDNASSDQSQEQCLQRVRRDRRIRYFRQATNIGVFRNYNELFRKCDTKYFKWQSSNDWCEKKFLATCIEEMESDPRTVLVFSTVNLVDENGRCETYKDDFGLEMASPADRFVYLLENIKLCNVFNGVIRTEALRHTGLNRPFRGSDAVLMAELALRGRFVLISDSLWNRTMTAATSTKLRSSEQKGQFFAGSASNYDKFVSWKTTFALFGSVLTAEIALYEKMKCLRYLFRRTLSIRHDLFRELQSFL
jgi:glycosyltransferase involved in cell wall biosynthesis